MFGDVSRLQINGFFSIGHSFPALAFVVSGSKTLADGKALRLHALRTCSSDLSVRTA